MLRASAVPEPVQEAPPITHQGDSDAQNTAFWKKLITSNPESLVAKETAVFAVRTLLLQTLGYKAHRAQINFADDPVTVGDMFDLLEKLSGPAGWALANRLACVGPPNPGSHGGQECL
jgi:hypothetical protein